MNQAGKESVEIGLAVLTVVRYREQDNEKKARIGREATIQNGHGRNGKTSNGQTSDT